MSIDHCQLGTDNFINTHYTSYGLSLIATCDRNNHQVMASSAVSLNQRFFAAVQAFCQQPVVGALTHGAECRLGIPGQ